MGSSKKKGIIIVAGQLLWAQAKKGGRHGPWDGIAEPGAGEGGGKKGRKDGRKKGRKEGRKKKRSNLLLKNERNASFS